MIALCYLLGVLLAGSLALNGWLTFRTVRGVEGAAKSEIGATHFESALELAHFELEQTKRALVAVEARADALEEIIAEELNAHPNADLDRADWRTRVMRVAQQWGRSDRAGREVPADTAQAVPPQGTAEPPEADLRSADGLDV